jgi:hypothetical protein
MPCDPHHHLEQESERIRKLAAEIAECIVKQGLLTPEKAEFAAARRVCPPNRLCCWAGYTCDPPFYCDRYFGCVDYYSGLTVSRS